MHLSSSSSFVCLVRVRFVRARSLVVRSLVRPPPPPPLISLSSECSSAAQGVRACDVPENPSFTCFFASIHLYLTVLFYLTTLPSYLPRSDLICSASLALLTFCAQQPSILFHSLPPLSRHADSPACPVNTLTAHGLGLAWNPRLPACLTCLSVITIVDVSHSSHACVFARVSISSTRGNVATYLHRLPPATHSRASVSLICRMFPIGAALAHVPCSTRATCYLCTAHHQPQSHCESQGPY